MSLELRGPFRANRFAICTRSRIFSANWSRFEKSCFCKSAFQKMDSSEDWTRITRIWMWIGEKTRFARIWPSASKKYSFFCFCESIRANLGSVGVRIDCPLSFGDRGVGGQISESKRAGEFRIFRGPQNFKGTQTMKCKVWTQTLEFSRLKVPNSRFALHGLAPPKFTVCAPFLPLIHGLCAFFRLLLTPLSTAPFPAILSVHGLHFTVCAPSKIDPFLQRFYRKSSSIWGSKVSLEGQLSARVPPLSGTQYVLTPYPNHRYLPLLSASWVQVGYTRETHHDCDFFAASQANNSAVGGGEPVTARCPLAQDRQTPHRQRDATPLVLLKQDHNCATVACTMSLCRWQTTSDSHAKKTQVKNKSLESKENRCRIATQKHVTFCMFALVVSMYHCRTDNACSSREVNHPATTKRLPPKLCFSDHARRKSEGEAGGQVSGEGMKWAACLQNETAPENF